MTPPGNVMVCYPAVLLRAQGEATLRVTAELREFLEGEDVPESLRLDIEAMEAVGKWLAGASLLDLSKPLTAGIPAAGHHAAGFPAAAADAIPLPWTGA